MTHFFMMMVGKVAIHILSYLSLMFEKQKPQLSQHLKYVKSTKKAEGKNLKMIFHLLVAQSAMAQILHSFNSFICVVSAYQR